MVDSAEFWTGKGVDYAALWNAYTEGTAYIRKYQTMTVHLLRIEFHGFGDRKPMFNFEAIYKTVKGYFHDMKEITLSPRQYDLAGPLFLYSIDRGSEVWNFLGELRQILTLGTTLADEKVIGQRLDNIDKRLGILAKYFGGAVDPDSFRAFMRAKTPNEIEMAVRNLLEHGLAKVGISQLPFDGDMKKTESSLVDVTKIIKETN
ncbi:MAG TPA: hypothetical protein VEK73_01435 [Xanthobacteraceae bacterium]|nr:hypothetical protein [Xanthobacteraceae bacterium]